MAKARIFINQKNLETRQVYINETKLKPLHYSDCDWYTREYQMWMEDKLNDYITNQTIQELEDKIQELEEENEILSDQNYDLSEAISNHVKMKNL